MLPLKDNIPTRVFPIVTVVIILMNVAVYWGFERAGVFSGPTDNTFVAHYSFIPYELSHPGKLCGLRARSTEGIRVRRRCRVGSCRE